jgi:hypothetical protein
VPLALDELLLSESDRTFVNRQQDRVFPDLRFQIVEGFALASYKGFKKQRDASCKILHSLFIGFTETGETELMMLPPFHHLFL